MKMLQVASFARSHRRLVSLIIGIGTLSVAAIAVAAIVSGNSTTGASSHVTYTQLTLPVPTVSAGDVMIASVAVKGATAAVMVTVPSGWTQIARADNDTNVSLISYWKVASASEPASYAWTIQDQTRAEGGITGYSGVDTSNPIDTSSTNTGRGKIATTTATTTGTPNEEVIALFATDVGTTSSNGYFSAPTTTSMTQKYNASNAAQGPSVAAFDKLQSATGTTGTISSGTGDNKTRDWAAQEIVLRQPTPGIAFDNSVASAVVSASTQTTSFTTSGSNICVVAQVNSDHNDVSATYDGVAMTKIANLGGLPGTGQSTVFVLAGATAGTHDIVVTASGGTEGLATIAASYDNCGATQPDSFTTSTVNSAMNFSESATSMADNAWGVLLMQSNFTGDTTVGAGTTLRASNGNGQFVVDTNGPIHPAGSATLNLFDTSNTTNWLGVMLTLAPAS
jgi:hypothetical protein